MRQSVRVRSTLALSAIVALATWAPTSYAQQPSKRPPKTPAAQPAAPTTPAPPLNTPLEVPPPPTVNDPMLAPVPPAAKNVGSWEQALDMVRARSTDLRIAFDQVKAAEAQSRVALGSALPTLQGTGAATYNFLTKDQQQIAGLDVTGGTITPRFQSVESPTRGPFLTGSLVAAVPLLSPRAWYGIGTAHATEDFARLSVEDAKRTIALNVANSLIGVVTAERVAELNRIGFRSALERLELAQRRKQLGAATGLDVVRAQQDVESARATLVTGDESLRKTREALGLALGTGEPIGVEPSISLDGIEKSAGTACKPAGSIEERADIAAARQNVVRTERTITDAKYQYSPTITAQSTLSATSVDSNQQNPTWNIQAILSVPFYDGGIRDGQRRAAYAATDQAEQQLVAKRRAAEVDVARARRQVSVATDSRKVAADARQLAAELDRLTRAQYIEGEGTSLDLVIAGSGLRNADVNLALRDFELVQARIVSLLALANCPF
ncbi:TolC family protein [Pendulispora albinea]|uniref:TolC family protein n=1 Tax=Pendulispora albinea TaxID=2741071 RepID=A0ABZ2LJY7_9BACT